MTRSNRIDAGTLREAFDRFRAFQAVQNDPRAQELLDAGQIEQAINAAIEAGTRMAQRGAVEALFESVGLGTETRIAFYDEIALHYPPGSDEDADDYMAVLGLIVGLTAAQLQAERK